MAWPKGRKLSASHRAAISRSLKGKSRRAAGRTARASGRIVKRALRNKNVQAYLIGTGAVVALNATGSRRRSLKDARFREFARSDSYLKGGNVARGLRPYRPPPRNRIRFGRTG